MTAQAYLGGKKEIAPSEVISIDYQGEGEYTVTEIYVNDGKTMSASSIVLPYGEELFLGKGVGEK